MVEIELSIPSQQCLARRVGDIEALEREVLAWARQRSDTVQWQLTRVKARDKFKTFYPNLA